MRRTGGGREVDRMGGLTSEQYPTEINALEMRTKGASLAMATNWIMVSPPPFLSLSVNSTRSQLQNYAVVQVTLPGISNLGYRFWIIWAVICFAFIPITYLFYPETANRTLEDIDRFFETRPGIFVNGNKLAVQLHRPQEFVEMDDRIAREEEEARRKEDGFAEEKGTVELGVVEDVEKQER